MNYILVKWPESQIFMGEEWFQDEAILALSHEEITGSIAYFIPENRIISNDYISNRIEELSSLFVVSEEEMGKILSEWDESIPYEGGMSVFELIANIKYIISKK